jgi:hypothetical protein
VPGWIVEYGSKLLENLNRGTLLTKEVIKETFTAIGAICMAHWKNSLDQDDLIKLAAYSIAGQIVDLEDSPVARKTWSVLLDEFLFLKYHHYDDRKVIIPYTTHLFILSDASKNLSRIRMIR